MCGGFALLAGNPAAPGGPLRAEARRTAAYLCGKTATYSFLGALAGSAGAGIVATARWAGAALSVAAGSFMLLAAFRLLRGGRAVRAGPFGIHLSRLLAPLWSNLRSPFGIGVATGFLPCGVVGLGIVAAASRSSALEGLVVMAALGVIAPYEEIDKSVIDKWKPNFVPEIWDSTVVKGKFYGPSSYVDMGSFLVFNKKMFEEAGLSKPPENWDQVKEYAKKLTKPDRAGITLSATTATNDANNLEGIAYANGGRWLDEAGKKVMIDDAGFVDALQLYVDLIKDKVTPQGVTETAFGQSATLFFEGKAAMWIALSYGKAIQQSQGRPDDFPLGMVLFPRQAKTTGFAKPAATIMTPTAAVAISALSQQKEAALKYAEFWSRADVQAGWDGSVIRGRVPALKANWETDTFKKIYPDWYQLYKEGKMFDGSVPMPSFPGLVEAEKQLSTAMQQAILGQGSAKDVLTNAAKRAQQIVDEFSKV